jgi:hypothetical protein
MKYIAQKEREETRGGTDEDKGMRGRGTML